MGKNVKEIWGGMIGWMAAAGGIAAYITIKDKDRKAFRELVTDKGLTHPRDIWNACSDHNTKLRKELAEAKATIKAAQEVCEVADGLVSVRKMVEDHDPPAEVKQAIISHWWTKLMKLFVPWGIVMPEEIDTHHNLYFRLASMVDPGAREATLRAYVYQYKEAYESYKKLYNDTFSHLTVDEKATIFERKYKMNEERDEEAGGKAVDFANAPWLKWAIRKPKDKTEVKPEDKPEVKDGGDKEDEAVGDREATVDAWKKTADELSSETSSAGAELAEQYIKTVIEGSEDDKD